MMKRLTVFLACVLFAISALPIRADDPLSFWKSGPAKKAIIEFVDRVTDPKSPDFVRPAERIATFDNDGTLWSEQLLYLLNVRELWIPSKRRFSGP